MKITLDNMDHDDGMVTVYCHDQAAAEDDQTIDGASWECPSDMDCAYAFVMDRADLVADLEKEGYEVDQTEYCAPEPGKCLVCREDSGGPKNMTCGEDHCRAAIYGDDACLGRNSDDTEEN